MEAHSSETMLLIPLLTVFPPLSAVPFTQYDAHPAILTPSGR